MDKRVEKTREAIVEAYLALIMEKRGSKITISEVASRANIARKTFYLHYESLEDVSQDASRRKLDDLILILERHRFFKNPFDTDLLFHCLNQLIEPDIDLYRYLSKENPELFFWSQLKRTMIRLITESYKSQIDMPAPELRLYAEYFISGVTAVYISWLREEIPLPFEKLASLVGEATLHGIRKPQSGDSAGTSA